MSETTIALTVESSTDRVALYRDGSPHPILVQSAEPDHRAYIHPIVAPDGVGVITENAPSHHLWQHGLYIGLNAVNGYGFWKEGLGKTEAELDGTFHPHDLRASAAEGGRATWAVGTEYRSPRGEALLDETQSWSFADHGDRYVLDLSWTLTALVAVEFGEYPYGGLFLRMPFRPETGGSAFNSEGHDVAGADGERARWVAVQMPIEGRDAESQVAIMDHPQNLQHPVPWRVDHQLGISPSVSIAGAWSLARGESREFLHRVVVYSAPVDAAVIEESWQEFSEGGTAS